MSFVREIVRDDAVAIAKSCGHGAVEPRHVLWGVLRALQGDAPADIPFDAVVRLLDPHGTSVDAPTVSPEVETVLAEITDVAAAVALAHRLAGELGVVPAADTASPTAEGNTTTTDGADRADTRADAAPGAAPAVETEASILAELDALIGLAPVKVEIRRLLALQHLNTQRAAAGLPVVNASKHLVFTGDPGTGKTTVARLVGRLYRVAGLVSKGQLIEAAGRPRRGLRRPDRAQGPEVVGRALGGILFIDEAYALAQGGYADFGDEAIATLVQLMEEHRDDLAVIAAGYDDEMRDFIDANPGLRSRFTHYIDFPNYDADELVRIFAVMAAQASVTPRDGVTDRVPGTRPRRDASSRLRQCPVRALPVRGRLREHGRARPGRRHDRRPRAPRDAARRRRGSGERSARRAPADRVPAPGRGAPAGRAGGHRGRSRLAVAVGPHEQERPDDDEDEEEPDRHRRGRGRTGGGPPPRTRACRQ